ncbi:hypothetical protein KIN20_000924 [Parelaphostrongylus tenuis]|uniref:Uncharacterized protein n=1 Tax=Parelaphostrongylus tenuis TaxID=148309 RepID=A0AAD5QE47_PARTN|nr:hypothetical protein KIN20_000924 [Parelaphostrongylus tenuis]
MRVEERPGWAQAISIQDALREMLLCCCWPVHKCVTLLSCFDTLIVAVFAYKSFNLLVNTIYEPHWTTIVSFLFFLSFFTCQLTATIYIILAHRRNLAHYCYPRLVLITGLIVCSVIACAVTIFYLNGSQTTLNNFIFRLCEYFFGEIDDRERAELKSELKIYAGAFLALGMTFCVYSIIELLLTHKFYKSLKGFAPVPQGDPSAPQPAFNPDFTQTTGKVYPNYA